MTEAKKALRGIIYSTYETEKDCAIAMGWPKQRLNKIANGKKEPSVSEVSAIAKAVKRSVGEVAEIFLAMWSPNG